MTVEPSQLALKYVVLCIECYIETGVGGLEKTAIALTVVLLCAYCCMRIDAYASHQLDYRLEHEIHSRPHSFLLM